MAIAKQRPFGAFCVAAAGSGEGKTTISLALMRALTRRGLTVQPFKCGPDYIDPSFHDFACRRKSRNLDDWMMGENEVKKSFAVNTSDADCAVIEGVMGLFDGAQPGQLQGSTANIALLTDTPVILAVNCRGMAGSIAATVKGYAEFCPRLRVIGVIANRTGSDSHADILRQALELAGLPPLLGHLPRNEAWKMPERHLGLVPFAENTLPDPWFEKLADAVEQYCDLDRIIELVQLPRPVVPTLTVRSPQARLAIALDEAFHFYYADNLDCLRRHGIETVPFSPLRDIALPPDIDGVYLGGGFPEMFAAELEGNESMRTALRDFHAAGNFIYAECGGFMYLSENITDATGATRKMCGLLPGRTTMNGRLRSLGYREARTVADTPFGPAGTTWRGHEFHWSDIEYTGTVMPLWHIAAADGRNLGGTGVRDHQLFASYIHLHFSSNPEATAGLADYLGGLRRCRTSTKCH